MIARRPIQWLAAACLAAAALGATKRGPDLPREAEVYRAEYEAAVKSSDDATQRLMQGLELTYADRLRQLQYLLQYAGRLRELMAVYDEARRFQARHAPPAPTAATEPAELKLLAEEHLRSLRAAQYSNDVCVTRAAAIYVQNLAILRRSMAERADPDMLLALDAERDGLLTNTRIRKAVAGSLAGPGSLTNQAAVAVDTGSGVEVSDRILRMYGPGNEDVAVVMGYTISVGLTEDTSRVRERLSEGAKTSAKSQDGAVGYQVRINIGGRNSEVPPGSRLVVEYFSRSLTDNSKKYHSSEQSVLPGIGRGESYTAEFKGISLYRSESVSTSTRGSIRSYSGDEFHGLTVSLLDPEGRVIMQRFHPQSLSREVTDTPGIR
ncbi:MAG: hypothetical protein FJ221_06505 [Lentisphaerae bacterium]|nr:hypothetical protein [Lentisphaerota bacterium]